MNAHTDYKNYSSMAKPETAEKESALFEEVRSHEDSVPTVESVKKEEPAKKERPQRVRFKVVNAHALNIRTAASATADVVTIARKDEVVTATGAEEDGFIPVSYKGKRGFCMKKYLEEVQ